MQAKGPVPNGRRALNDSTPSRDLDGQGLADGEPNACVGSRREASGLGARRRCQRYRQVVPAQVGVCLNLRGFPVRWRVLFHVLLTD